LSGGCVTRCNASCWARASLWGVDTSSVRWVAAVYGTRISVITVGINIGTCSVSLVAFWNDTQVVRLAFLCVDTSLSGDIRINGTCIVIVTSRSDTFASSGSRVTFVDCSSWWGIANNWLCNTSSSWVTEGFGTLVSGLAGDRSLNKSLDWVAFGDETLVGFTCNHCLRDIFEYALSSLGVARVLGTYVVIVTCLWVVNTHSGISVTAISGTCIVIITFKCNV